MRGGQAVRCAGIVGLGHALRTMLATDVARILAPSAECPTTVRSLRSSVSITAAKSSRSHSCRCQRMPGPIGHGRAGHVRPHGKPASRGIASDRPRHLSKRPSVGEGHDGTFAPILEIDFGAVFARNRVHCLDSSQFIQRLCRAASLTTKAVTPVTSVTIAPANFLPGDVGQHFKTLHLMAPH